MSGRRALGLLIGTALDAVLPDPRRAHPVAGFGALAGRLEQCCYADDRRRGAVFAGICVGGALLAGALAERRESVLVTAAATWTVLGSRSLRAEARYIHDLLGRGELDAARARVTHLVSRDPSRLDADGVARAAVESVAENSCDAAVAPLFWGAIAGVPGLLGYRAVNTLDAMVGYRSPRYARFGWAAARLDDLANLVPARLTAVLVALVSGRQAPAALRTALVDGRKHPSPNSGWSEAAFAGTLGLRLGGRNSYDGQTEERPRLGIGRPPRPADLPRSARLCGAVTGAAALAAAALAWLQGLGRR